MADDSRLLQESSDDLPRRVRGVNWRVAGQAVATPELARFQRPPPQVGGQLPKRVPGTSAFRAARPRARVRSVPAVLDSEAPPAPTAPEPVTSGLVAPKAATLRPPPALPPELARVPAAR